MLIKVYSVPDAQRPKGNETGDENISEGLRRRGG